MPIILNDVALDYSDEDSSEFMNQEDIDAYREAQYKED